MILSQATTYGMRLLNLLQKNQCIFRGALAGELRRQRPLPNNVELLVEPYLLPVVDMFGDVRGRESALSNFLSQKPETFTLNKSEKHNVITGKWLDGGEDIEFTIYIASKSAWPAYMLTVTGPKAFSDWFFTQRSKGGAMPLGFSKDGNHIRHWGSLLVLDTERELFDLFSVRYVSPEVRDSFSSRSYKSLLLSDKKGVL